MRKIDASTSTCSPEQCEKAELRVLGFCLMTNHVHLVVVPEHEAAMAQASGVTQKRPLRVT
jgi:REP element-mobilizing transposase RayT